jgi:hypothetical protein
MLARLRMLPDKWRHRLLHMVGASKAMKRAQPRLSSRCHRRRNDVAILRQGRRAVVRTIWIARTGELNPRFVTVGCCDDRRRAREQ